MKKLLVTMLFAVLFSACKPLQMPPAAQNTMPEQPMKDAPQIQEQSESASSSGEQQAVYDDYSDDILLNGEAKVLFFYAAWCPICRAEDKDLMAWFSAQEPSVNVYRVNYDTATELRSTFGVTYQHTFVLVDGQGNALQTIQGPTDAQLRSMIGV